MKIKICMLLGLVPVLFFAVSCQFGMQNFFFRAPNPDQRSGTLTSIADPLTFATGGFSDSNSGSLKFLMVTDLHYGSKSKYPEQAFFDSFGTERPDFVVMLGDSAEAGLQESFDRYEDFLNRMRAVSQVTGFIVQDFAIPGNHDLYNDGYKTWEQVRKNAGGEAGASFYRFTTTLTDGSGTKYSRSWYFLDSGSSTLGDKQLKSLQSAIKDDPNPKMILTHYPFFAEGSGFIDYFKWSNTYERAVLINLFNRNNVHMYLSGHWHPGSNFGWGKFHELCGGSFREDHKNVNHWYYVTINEVLKTIVIQEYQTEKGDSGTVRLMPPVTYSF